MYHIYLTNFTFVNTKITLMKNLLTFLSMFFVLNIFTAFQEEFGSPYELAELPAKIMISENSKPIALLDKSAIDSLQMYTDVDLSGLDPATIQTEADLKKNLIQLVGSFITMIIMFFLRRLFPEKMKLISMKINSKEIGVSEGSSST